MNDPANAPQLRVRVARAANGVWQRWRAGMHFGREARDLTAADLGAGLAAVAAVGALLADPYLKVTLVERGPDGEELAERDVTAEELAALTEVLEAEHAAADLMVDPAAPPPVLADVADLSVPQEPAPEPAPVPAPEPAPEPKPEPDTTSEDHKPAGGTEAPPAAEPAPATDAAAEAAGSDKPARKRR